MTNKTKQYKLLTMSAILLITSAVYSNAQIESARINASQFETMDVQELINGQSQEMTLPRPETQKVSGLASESDLKYTEEELRQAIEFFSGKEFDFERWEGKVYRAPEGIKMTHEITDEDWKLVYPVEYERWCAVDGSFGMTFNNPAEVKKAFIEKHLGRIRFFIGMKLDGTIKSFEIRNPRQLVNLYRSVRKNASGLL